MIKEPKNITISVDDPNRFKTLQMTLNWDANLDDWIDVFKTILIHQTFAEDTVKELFEDKDLYCLDETPNLD